MHRLLRGDFLAHERLAIDCHNLVAGYHAATLCRTVGNHILHMYRILAYGELDADAVERALQIVVARSHFLGAHIHRMRIELCQNLRNGFLHYLVDINAIYILVVDDVEKIRQTVRFAVDDIQLVAREVIGVERANQYADNRTQSHQQGHESVSCVHFLYVVV